MAVKRKRKKAAQKEPQEKIYKPTIKEGREIAKIILRLKEGMIDFIEPGETSYTEKDVEKCMSLILKYLQEMENATSKDEAIKIVEKTVLSLNDVNEDCEHELIETDQREDIAAILTLAGNLKGFNSREEDITEEWREW